MRGSLGGEGFLRRLAGASERACVPAIFPPPASGTSALRVGQDICHWRTLMEGGTWGGTMIRAKLINPTARAERVPLAWPDPVARPWFEAECGCSVVTGCGGFVLASGAFRARGGVGSAPP
jgi:hypothetical protein